MTAASPTKRATLFWMALCVACGPDRPAHTFQCGRLGGDCWLDVCRTTESRGCYSTQRAFCPPNSGGACFSSESACVARPLPEPVRAAFMACPLVSVDDYVATYRR
jgi:hypothetical protein